MGYTMVRYAENELLSITDLTKQMNRVMKSIKDHTIEKVGVLKNNKLEAVVISTEEYNRLKAMEELIEVAEYQEIYELLQARKETPKDAYFSLEEMAKKFDINLDSI